MHDEDWYDDEQDDHQSDDLSGCPECGAEIYADAEQCPACGYWVTDEDRRAAESLASGWSSAVKAVAVGLLMMFLVSLLLWGTIF
jgi:uncharacterized membrane protein YvbJ